MFKRFFSIHCNAWGLTDVGLSRTHNEDNILINPEKKLFLLADGMGGHEAGEIASQLAITSIDKSLHGIEANTTAQSTRPQVDEIPEVEQINQAIFLSNSLIHKENNRRGFSDGNGMGTTIVGCWYRDKHKMALIFHAGDSRAYSVYKNKLSRLTRDHSLLELWKDNSLDGEKPSANVLTKALGPFEFVTPDIAMYPVKKGEKIILCSDGLSNMITDEQILSTVKEQKDNLQAIPQYLIDQANQAGGSDNISVIVISFF